MRSLGAAFLCAARVLLPMNGEAAETVHRPDGSELTHAEIDREAGRLMAARNVPGLTIALIENGKPVFVRAYGLANTEKKQPLRTDTVVYGASLTKLAFAYLVMQLG